MTQPALPVGRYPATLFANIAQKLVLGVGLTAGAATGYFATAQLPASATRAADLSSVSSKRRDGLVDIVEKVKAAVVNIHSERTLAHGIDDPLRGSLIQPQRVKGMGTGIVLDPRGYIVTNFHVIDEIQSLRVGLIDGRQLSARILATDKKADLALIKIDVASPLPTVPLGTATDLLDAEQVIAIGNAFGYEHTVSIGNIAFKSRDVSLNKEISYQGLIQTTAPINPGNSGGPLFNKKGELVGVNVAIRAGAQNIAFAIPVDTMIEHAADMLSSRKRAGLRHGLILKDKVDRLTEESAVRRVVTIERLEANSSAASSGFLAGDVIERVGDIETRTSIDVERGFLERTAGSKVPVTVRRAAETIELHVVLQSDEARASVVPGDAISRRTGLKMLPVGREIVSKVDAQLRGGMSVIEVGVGTQAAKAGLQKGDVIIGFHQWEAVNIDNVLFAINHKDLATFNPIKTFFLRDGKVRETQLGIAE